MFKKPGKSLSLCSRREQRTAEAHVQGQSDSKIESHHVRNVKVFGD